jgi:hypothetical protein
MQQILATFTFPPRKVMLVNVEFGGNYIVGQKQLPIDHDKLVTLSLVISASAAAILKLFFAVVTSACPASPLPAGSTVFRPPR